MSIEAQTQEIGTDRDSSLAGEVRDVSSVYSASSSGASNEPAYRTERAIRECISVDRASLEQLQDHLMYVYDRFPTRRLKAGIQITRHLLRGSGKRPV